MTYSYTEILDAIKAAETTIKRNTESIKAVKKIVELSETHITSEFISVVDTKEAEAAINWYNDQTTKAKANLTKYKKMLRLIDELDKLENDQ